MKDMTKKERIWFIFLQIITLGLIWVYWSRKAKDMKKENEFSFARKLSINVNELIKNLGGIDNILDVEFTYKKVKIYYKSRDKIFVDYIKNIKGISGVFLNENGITLIVGNESKILKETIKNLMLSPE